MNLPYLTKESINQFIKLALAEDVGSGDHSTLASVPEHEVSNAQLLIKEAGIIAGVDMAGHIFNTIDSSLEIDYKVKDGESVEVGQVGLVVKGSSRSILLAERLVLNCMQRMSGIATYTRSLTELIRASKAQLLDTRKTTPNFRLLEKWAVAIGGGTNHRFGLYDMIMLKDNHIDFCGGISKAIAQTKNYLKTQGLSLKIEVETRSLNEVKEVLKAGGVDVIMLDNMMPSMMKEAVQLINGKSKIEASGGINETTITEVAETGVDYISVGALTHSTRSIDISLKAIK